MHSDDDLQFSLHEQSSFASKAWAFLRLFFLCACASLTPLAGAFIQECLLCLPGQEVRGKNRSDSCVAFLKSCIEFGHLCSQCQIVRLLLEVSVHPSSRFTRARITYKRHHYLCRRRSNSWLPFYSRDINDCGSQTGDNKNSNLSQCAIRICFFFPSFPTLLLSSPYSPPSSLFFSPPLIAFGRLKNSVFIAPLSLRDVFKQGDSATANLEGKQPVFSSRRPTSTASGPLTSPWSLEPKPSLCRCDPPRRYLVVLV